MTEFDGAKLLVQFYANHGRLSLVEKKTGVPKDKIRRWLDGEDCLTSEEDAAIRKPCKEFGGKVKVTQ